MSKIDTIEENLLISSPRFLRIKDYWVKKLSGKLPCTRLLYARAEQPEISSKIGKTVICIPEDLSHKVIKTSKNSDLSIYLILLAILKVLIYRYGQEKDIIVLSPVYQEKVTAETLNNALFIRTRVLDGMSFKELVLTLRQSVLEAYFNQDYPLEKLIEYVISPDSHDTHGTGIHMISRVGCSLTNIHGVIDGRESEDKIIFSFTRDEDRIRGEILYNPLVHKKFYIRQSAAHFVNIMQEVIRDIDMEISRISFISPGEKEQLIEGFNRQKVEYPVDSRVHELFARQVERTPDHIALVGKEEGWKGTREEGKKETAITYRELNKQSDQLAYSLKEKGVGPDTIVGLMVEQGIEMIIGIMGILKVGGAYLPIDPGYPGERIRFMLADSSAEILLTTKEISALLSVSPIPTVASAAKHAVFSRGDPGNLVYVIYTSGSTGNPKGVLVEHGNVVVYVYAFYREFPITADDTVIQLASYAFDIFVEEIFPILLRGGKLIIPDETEMIDIQLLSRLIPRHQVNIIDCTPLLLKAFNQLFSTGKGLGSHVWRHVHTFISGGDILKPSYIDNLLKTAKVYNTYGPTESTVCATYYPGGVDESHSANIPIGKPIANYNLYILNRNRGLAPIGVSGELCISGPGVTRGYLNRPELTNQKFNQDLGDCRDRQLTENYKIQITNYKQITNHKLQITNRTVHELPQTVATSNKKFLRGGEKREAEKLGRWEDGKLRSGLRIISRPHPETNENQHHRFAQHIGPPRRGAPGRRRQKIYQSGDLARWLPDGNIEFLGRKDFQVKIRGYRVELEEIEQVLLEHRLISGVVVIAREDKGEKYLAAYFTRAIPGDIDQEVDLDVSSLQSYLSDRLPGYMLPSCFIPLETIPLTPVGKINKRALPPPRLKMDKESIAPRNTVEEKFVEIWSDVLALEKEIISIEANFFELGGHSLNAIAMIARIQRELNVKLPLDEFFKAPNIKALSGYIKDREKKEYTAIESTEKREYYALSSAQKRLYILQHLIPDNTAYNMPGSMIMEEQLEIEQLEKTFNQLIQRHESLRTSFQIVAEEPVQVIYDHVEFKIEYHWGNKGNESEENVINNFIRPFDLSKGPLMRVKMIKSGEKHLMLVDMHHIISDGVSLYVFVQDFMALLMGQKLSPLRLQYKDYSQWQNSAPIQNTIKKQEIFWMNRLAGDIPVLNLSTDYPRPKVQNFVGKTVYFEIDKEKTAALNTLAFEQNATLFMLLLALFNILLGKLSGQEDIIIGNPVSGRRHADLERVTGMLVNTLALRNYPKPTNTFAEFLEDLKKRTLGALENQEYPLEILVEKLNIKRKPGHHPLFDVMFTLDIREEEIAADRDEETAPEDESFQLNFRAARADMTWAASQQQGQLTFSVEYRTNLFKEETILRFIGYFEEIIAAVIKDKHTQLKDIRLHDNMVDIETNDFQEDIEEFEF